MDYIISPPNTKHLNINLNLIKFPYKDSTIKKNFGTME